MDNFLICIGCIGKQEIYETIYADARPGDKAFSRLNRYEAHGLLALVIAGLAASGAVLVFSLIHSG